MKNQTRLSAVVERNEAEIDYNIRKTSVKAYIMDGVISTIIEEGV